MKIDTKQIEWLFTHATAYQIAKLSGVAQPTITNVINRKRKLENLTISTGYKLTETALYIQKEILRRNELLIQDVLEDISLFGEGFEVFAIKIQDDFISDYVDATPPTKKELLSPKEFSETLANHKQNLSTLDGKEYERMTSVELLRKLEIQRVFFEE